MFLNLFVFLLSVSVIFSCILFLLSSNKIYSILYLIIIYMCTSLIMMYLGVLILGLFYFLVYIGAVAVLFLFSVMILDLKESVFERDYSFFLSIFLFIFILFVNIYLMYSKMNIDIYAQSYEYFINTNEFLLVLGLLLFSRYSLMLLLVGLILLIAMVGSIYLTNKKRGFFIKKQIYPLARNYDLYHCTIY